jgi:hypothetical protein
MYEESDRCNAYTFEHAFSAPGCRTNSHNTIGRVPMVERIRTAHSGYYS